MHAGKIKYIFLLLAGPLFCGFFPQLARGQMFSADDHYQQNRDIPGVAVYAGIEPINLEYQGASLEQGGADLYAFKGSLIRLMLESNGLALSLGTGGRITGIDDQSYFDAGIQFGYGLPITYNKQLLISVPVQLRSSYTNVSNDDVEIVGAPQFNQGTFAFGAGLDLKAKIVSQFRIGANIIPYYGFSFSTRERDASGSIFGVEGKARFYFDHLFGDAGLSIGYDYHLRQYDIEGQVLDYNAMANSFLIGITF